MKCSIPEISWHNREPVLSVDLHPVCEKFYRLATGGADCHVLIWQMNLCDNGAVKMEALSDLTRHQRAVNSVRWSSTGQYLASADDDANIIIWKLKTDNIPLLEGESNDKEVWIVTKILRGHKEDIYDLTWSPNGAKLLSGSIDNTAMLWDLAKGKNEQILTDHKGFVQGVSWDPKGHYIATISTDRICRIFDSSGKHVRARIQKGVLPLPEKHYLHNKEVKLFHDDTFKSFFRRLDFSPNGELLAVPSGCVEVDDSKKTLNATYLFAVDSWAAPIAVLPSAKQSSTVVRFCPIVFELHPDGPDAIISLPFRMILAVGTDHDVILYDTQQMLPFAYFRDIHYTRLTDLTWSKDGLLLVASSTDGFCALITFEPNELGIEYVKEESEVEESFMDVSGCEELDKTDKGDLAKDTVEVETPNKPKKPNLLEKWAIKSAKKGEVPSKLNNEKQTDTSKRKSVDDNSDSKNRPKRIKPLTITSSAKKEVEAPVKRITPTLINFLTPPKTKSREKAKSKPKETEAPIVILDENEACDSWKVEKPQPKLVHTVDIDESSELTANFTLQLEDSTQTSDSKKEEQKSEKIEENALKLEAAIDTKTKKTVKRVPLFTLSSPKQKK